MQPDQPQQTITLPIGDAANLEGTLSVPPQPTGLVIFAHGSGSSRHSPRNQAVAQTLQQHHLATLLFDLLTTAEEQLDQRTRQLRFNIDLLAERMVAITDWTRTDPKVAALKLGYFGASTGAAAALVAAAERPDLVAAVVSRGGRPDLAQPVLARVRAPTLLLVGELDTAVIRMNQTAQSHLVVENKLELIAGATHLFEEPGTLAHVANSAAAWFQRWLTERQARRAA